MVSKGDTEGAIIQCCLAVLFIFLRIRKLNLFSIILYIKNIILDNSNN
jgi:hypothetical protein